MRKMMLSLFNAVALSCLMACGGGDDDNTTPSSGNTITVDKTEISFDGNEGTATLTVSSDREWGTVTSDSWITVDPSNSVSHKATVTVKVAKNSNFDGREGTITFMAGTANTKVTVKQAGGNGVPDPNEITCPLPGYRLVWNDEFNEGSTPDLNKWTHEVKGDHWVNNELQNYVNGETPDGRRVTSIKNGALRITALKENGKVYSGRIYGNVKQGWKYAYVEAKIKLPSGRGTWPAFWMMPVNFTSWPHDGEIDIMEEVGYHKDYVSSSLHADGHVHSNGTQVTKEVYCKGAEGEFHVYAMEWTKDYFQFYVDGEKTLYYANDGNGIRNWPYFTNFYVILNLAWGGDWGGSQGVDESALPVTMEVDYVRVFQK